MTTFDLVLEHASRPDPYPLYAELRRTPVSRASDGSYVVSTYGAIVELLHDPRLSSRQETDGDLPPGFIVMDPPEHDRLRALAMRHFGPPHTPDLVDRLQPDLGRLVGDLVDRFPQRGEVDLVEAFAYPFPVTVICRMLGVPEDDEPRFHRWVGALVESLDPARDAGEQTRARDAARAQAAEHLAGLVHERRRSPGTDLLSGMATDGMMTDDELVSTALLLLVAGHETTVNLIANGALTLLRHPDVLERLRAEPELVVGLVEELLRFEPPVHFLPWRSSLDDIEVAGTTIPKGAKVTLVLAAGSRDPAHVTDPDRFDPDRRRLEHLGFGGGVHYCFGAPLARLETQHALLELARRLVEPRLVVDPPPYRPSPVLRGPSALRVTYAGILPNTA
jgi:cytochrome P450